MIDKMMVERIMKALERISEALLSILTIHALILVLALVTVACKGCK